MTFAQGVLRLVRSGGGAAAEDIALPPSEAAGRGNPAAPALASVPVAAPATPAPLEFPVEAFTGQGLGDIEAAVRLVEMGMAGRVVLAGIEPWPGLLWQAYQLAESADVLIIPQVARPGGRIDVVVTRDPARASADAPAARTPNG